MKLMFSQYDLRLPKTTVFEAIHSLNGLTEAPSIIQHANDQAKVYVRAKAERAKVFEYEAYAKKE